MNHSSKHAEICNPSLNRDFVKSVGISVMKVVFNQSLFININLLSTLNWYFSIRKGVIFIQESNNINCFVRNHSDLELKVGQRFIFNVLPFYELKTDQITKNIIWLQLSLLKNHNVAKNQYFQDHCLFFRIPCREATNSKCKAHLFCCLYDIMISGFLHIVSSREL